MEGMCGVCSDWGTALTCGHMLSIITEIYEAIHSYSLLEAMRAKKDEQ